jgi:hypothetical protein
MTDLAATTPMPGASGQTPIYAINGWWVFSGICFIYLFFNWYLQTQVLTDQVYFYSLGGRIAADKLGDFLAGQHRMSPLSYLVIPAFLLAKMTLISFCLLTGLLITGQKLSFPVIFKIVLFAESVFAVSALIRMLILAFSREILSLEQYANFSPLSLYSLLRPGSVPVWLVFPLQTLDIFQLGYWLLLAYGLRFYCRLSFRAALWQVICSYGTGLVCCMIGCAFLIFSYNS